MKPTLCSAFSDRTSATKATAGDDATAIAGGIFEGESGPEGLQRMFARDVARMKSFQNIPEAEIDGIAAAALVINGDKDAVLRRALGADVAARAIRDPAGHAHGEYLDEIMLAEKQSALPKLVVK